MAPGIVPRFDQCFRVHNIHLNLHASVVKVSSNQSCDRLCSRFAGQRRTVQLDIYVYAVAGQFDRIEFCCGIGAYLAGAGEDGIKYASEYGKHLGLGFQLVDDLLDYTVDSEQTGKPSLNDIKEGRITLPLIHAYGEEPGKTRELLNAYQNGQAAHNGMNAKVFLDSLGSLEFAYDSACRFLESARDAARQLKQCCSNPGAGAQLVSIEEKVLSALSPPAAV